jgi:hypothetical protein
MGRAARLWFCGQGVLVIIPAPACTEREEGVREKK